MSLFYKHEWDEENKELTLYINPSEAFFEFAVEFTNQKGSNERKENLLGAARQYSKQLLPVTQNIKSYRVKFQQFLVAILKEKQESLLTEPEIGEYGFYKIKPNDTLKDISQLLQINESVLMKENNLVSDTLFVGMELKIPAYRHTVVPSDSLQKVAQRYDTTKEAIRKINKLNTDCISPGLELKIPMRMV
ncbi:LysM peptidoglycan-binding domain-containing protein [Sutcliffiella halmapala]|uniref:LysM peptidoglycan-binding domain-containing protein n=1 Tax=Sutcliffiella halmapala TaxID=79882 RepID=UPI00147677F2|nr:LysM peptidoglycan-binding domain-containing protein [Sutcliffiella halmapala]